MMMMTIMTMMMFCDVDDDEGDDDKEEEEEEDMFQGSAVKAVHGRSLQLAIDLFLDISRAKHRK